MFRVLFLIMTFFTLAYLILWMKRKFDENKGKKRIKIIRTLAQEGELETAFNLAQKAIIESESDMIKAQCFYWQGFCLHQRGDDEGTREKLYYAFELDPTFDRLDQDDDFRRVCSEVRNAQTGPFPQ